MVLIFTTDRNRITVITSSPFDFIAVNRNCLNVSNAYDSFYLSQITDSFDDVYVLVM